MPVPVFLVAFTSLLGLLLILLFIIIYRDRIYATCIKLKSFQSRVTDKQVRSVMKYMGLFIPFRAPLMPFFNYYLIVENSIQIRVEKEIYDKIHVGDIVTVSEYSNGSYRLEYF